MGKADLHIHTRVSDGFGTIEEVVDHADHLGLDVIAVTDHEDATGGLRAREYAAKRALRLEVVPGAEVTTLQGHLLALWVEDSPRSFRGIERTLESIHTAEGLAVVPHPMSWLTRSLSERTIDRIVERNEAGVTFDAIETANPSPAGRVTARKALRANEEWWHLPGTGGSDAHHILHIGCAWTEFDGETAAELRESIIRGATQSGQSSYPSARRVGFRSLALGLAWGYAATPRKMLRARVRRNGR